MNNRIINKFVFLALAGSMIFLSSCQLGKKYKSPEINSENLYRDYAATDTANIASIPWNVYFQDASLQSLINEGLSNNFDLRIATTRIQQAEAALNMAKAAYFPNVALVGQVAHNRTSADKDGANKDVLGYQNTTYTLGASVSWELDLWGRLSRESRAKRAQFLSTHAYRNLIQTSLVANIATAYYSLMALDEQLRVTLESISLLEETVETMTALKEGAIVTGAAVEQSKSLLYSTRVSVPDIESQIRQLENSICLMLGRKSGSVARSQITAQAIPDHLKAGVPMQMITKRPDVQQAELGFRSAFELTNAARASFYPTITLNSQSMMGYAGSKLEDFFSPERLFANIIAGLTQPVFAQRKLQTQFKVAKAQQEEALLSFEYTVLSASKEVSDILYTFESSLRKNEWRKKQVEALNTSVYFTKELLNSGNANYTEVLTAEQNLLQAQLGEVNDKLQQLKATVDLYRALGGGTE